MDKKLKIVLILVSAILTMLFKTTVVLYGYGHGLVPLGMPIVSYWQMLGILALASLFTVDSANLRAAELDSNDNNGAQRLGESIGHYLIAWLVFWLVF